MVVRVNRHLALAAERPAIREPIPLANELLRLGEKGLSNGRRKWLCEGSQFSQAGFAAVATQYTLDDRLDALGIASRTELAKDRPIVLRRVGLAALFASVRSFAFGDESKQATITAFQQGERAHQSSSTLGKWDQDRPLHYKADGSICQQIRSMMYT